MAIFKRRLFYFGGFDPRGARHYHRIMREEAALWPDDAIHVGPRRSEGEDVAWAISTPDCECRQTFLVWDDLVRARWVRSPLAIWWRSLVAYWGFIGRLDWSIGRHFAPGSLFAFYFPGVALALIVPLGVLAGVVLGHRGVWAAFGGGVAGVAVGALLLMLWRLHGFWLLRFAIFNDAYVRGRAGPELDARLDRFAQTIAQALAGEEDEILLVTHSNGSVLAMPLMARLLERFGGRMPERFALVTLGGSIPLMAARRDASVLKATYDRVAQGAFRWLDLSSPTDGACVPRFDPFPGRPKTAPSGFLRINPRWYAYCDPATYPARRRDKYRTHFDYLRRMDRASPLDFLSLATAARPLLASIEAFEEDHGTHHLHAPVPPASGAQAGARAAVLAGMP